MGLLKLFYNMNPLNILKATFSENLEKQGSSLQELEEALKSFSTKEEAEKVAALLKKAFLMDKEAFLGLDVKLDKANPLDLATKGLGLYGGSILAGGYAGAKGLDMIDNHVSNENKKLQSYKDKIKLLEKLTKKVHQENL